jgi:hypothetical protein
MVGVFNKSVFSIKQFGYSFTAIFLAVALAITASTATFARKWTITQRESALIKQIDAGQKSGELTLKEATNLRDNHAKILDKANKMKAKNGGKLSYADENKLEKQLNKLSDDIHSKKLQKRVEK